MRLTNYWLLLIWLFIGGAIFGSMPRRQEQLGSRTVTRWEVLPAVALVLPYILWAGFRDDLADTGLYRTGFLESASGFWSLWEPFLNDIKDPGFSALMIFLKSLIGNRAVLFFLIVAAFQLLCVALTYRRYAEQYWLCIFLFIVSTDYISWMLNGMRQFLAAAAIFACFPLMVRRKFGPLLLVILLFATVHGSALLMLPVVFLVQGDAWNRKMLLVLAAAGAVTVFPEQFSALLGRLLEGTHYDNMVGNELWAADDGTSILRTLVYSVPALLALFGLKYVRSENDPVINISVNCAVVTMALYVMASSTSGMYIGRLPIYTTLQGYIALPWLIDHIFDEKSAQLVKVLMILLYLLFFYYQMHFTWTLL